MLEEDSFSASFFSSSNTSPRGSQATPDLTAPAFPSPFDVSDPWSTSAPAPDHRNGSALGTQSTSKGSALDSGANGSIIGHYSSMPSLGHHEVNVSVATVLAGIQLPLIYETAWKHAGPSANRVSVGNLTKVLEFSGLTKSSIQKILDTAVSATASSISRNEFNVALALAALAQKNMTISLENLAEHRDDLPQPNLPGIETLIVQPQSSSRSATNIAADNDPWRTSTQPTQSSIDALGPGPTSPTPTPRRAPALRTGDAEADTSDETGRLLGPDIVTVAVVPEKEGFLFKHVNYVVESQQLNTHAIRRYSDFWWLMEVLVKRYPFRILPSLPPKKLGGMDDNFLEKRRKGLTRFINFIIRHPVLRQDEVVRTYLREPMDITTWRKQYPPVLDEEFLRKNSTLNLEEIEGRIPSDLEDRLAKARKRLQPALEHYANMCYIMERLIKRQEAQATDCIRWSLALNSLSESDRECHVEDCYNCGQIVQGYEQVASHLQRVSSMYDDDATLSSDTVLENLKRHRDLLNAFKEMLDRRDRLATNNIESLQKRVANNQVKLNQIRGVPGEESNADKLQKSIESDQQSIVTQMRRQTYTNFNLANELDFFHHNNLFVAKMYSDFMESQTKFQVSLADLWKKDSTSVGAFFGLA
ncbi:hypothetical protein BZG36_00632 [Bifiguratus adelaidae]|uniref:Sorting nexin MVP1 n=1 Tax=Bifiguratus adelaidae TaxID=1938954 RepID=A0A261Y7D7_9FUNG|nr:hypothetical protein BZG36_00632 [Bifiguratus adelaidae]